MARLQSNHKFHKSDIKPAINHCKTTIQNSPGPNSRGKATLVLPF